MEQAWGFFPKRPPGSYRGGETAGQERREKEKEEEGKGQGTVGHCAGKNWCPCNAHCTRLLKVGHTPSLCFVPGGERL